MVTWTLSAAREELVTQTLLVAEVRTEAEEESKERLLEEREGKWSSVKVVGGDTE